MPNRALSRAAGYWDDVAENYDRNFADSILGRSRRDAVWREMDRLFLAGNRLLELNCGTGIDAVHLAQRRVHVAACDISSRMVELGRARAAAAGVADSIDFHVLPTEEIAALRSEGPFDAAFSNFSGLNCVEDLGAVVRDLSDLLQPAAPLLICMMGRFVPVEMLWFLAQGKPKKAVRRFLWHDIHDARDGSVRVQCPTVKEIVRLFAPCFTLRRLKGIGILVPPSYAEPWAQRLPALVRGLARVDRALAPLPGIRHMADCMLFEFSRRVHR